MWGRKDLREDKANGVTKDRKDSRGVKARKDWRVRKEKGETLIFFKAFKVESVRRVWKDRKA
jgi:hypothetical protein